MGFVDDLWTLLLSDDEAEEQEALDRLLADEAATETALATFFVDESDSQLPQPRTGAPEAAPDQGPR